MMIKLDFIPVPMRLPLKFGAETVASIQIAHVEMACFGSSGIGETPLSAGWAWPSAELSFSFRERMMCEFCRFLADHYPAPETDPMTSGYGFLCRTLPELHARFNREKNTTLPHLAALICSSAFDIAVHDAFAKAQGLPVYQTYGPQHLRHDLAYFFEDDRFAGKYPCDYFVSEPPSVLPVWHLVGGKDLLHESERTGAEPDDGYPVSLEKWIERDGLKCLKIKLTGRDAAWDLDRLLEVGKIAKKYGCDALSPDFNCMVRDPAYVNDILDRLSACDPETCRRLLYVEQPFPYDLEANRIDVHSCSERKPLFMDESAHDWKLVRLGRELGWTGVALKVCKTQTGALLSACWAGEHGMKLMVQDLTNPMLAMMPHVLLAQHIGTIRGVECNAPQFYPEISLPFERKYPGLYERRGGVVDLSSIRGPGFGY
ncbi:MAG: mandelate racemase/muconate lactonizing enzyme family protein [Lentisphaeria bacterium]|nr:mandelate racemase/muconate lactonizing enzyme family protein [Lentisphaeria bacterium]